MAKKGNFIPKDNNIIRVPLEEAMPDNYLPYAVEVAKDRALPDVRDGLKPVHRRILYGAYMLKAFPDRPYYKSARIVGDILGKYHPHGDSSVYDAMVILAQNFTTREPLIDGHGNWGSTDGDNAAAMRYTEARLTPIAMELLKDIDKEVVDMMPNYSESEMEPRVLPARYPNLLVNGAFGIAVGLATNIPPHNLKEVSQALLAYIDNNDITTRELMDYVKGPDLPTGGIIIGKNSLLSAYETGEGKATLRARTNIEKLENGRLGIVITEFPYRRNKAKLLQTISEMTGDKRHAKALEAITDIRDETDRTGIRAVIELRKSADNDAADKVLKYLFKKTELQCNVNFNMVALANGKPETLGLKPMLMHYTDHQKEIITRRTQKELDIALRRFHIVEGFIKAIGIMDEIIATIRASKSKKDAQGNLVTAFGFTELQAEAILELMLYRLTGLEIKTFEKEYKELEKEITRLKKILASEKELLKVIKTELEDLVNKFGNERRTQIIEDENEAKIDLDELVVVEDTMVTLSNEGYIKRVPLKSYNRSNTDVADIEYREGDFSKYLFASNTKDTVLFFTDKGNMYQLKGIAVPEYKWREKGERLDELIRGLDLNEEKIVSALSLSSMSEAKEFVFFTSRGYIKKTALDKFNTAYSRIQALKLKENDRLIDVKLFESEREEEFIRVGTRADLSFTVPEPKLLSAERAVLGTQIVSLSEKDEITAIEYVKDYEFTSFTVGINNKGILRIYNENKSDRLKKVKTDTESRLLFFTSRGMAYSIPAYLLQGLRGKDIQLEALVDGYDENREKVLNFLSVKDFNADLSAFFFSASGLVKKTLLKEFDGEYISAASYKLKNEEDYLVNVEFGFSDKDTAVIVTKKGMAIRFETSGVSTMGRIASGVTGISLKEDDEVIYGTISISESAVTNNDEIAVSKETLKEMTLTTAKKEKKTILLSDIKVQNRAGRGSGVMLIVMDDYVKEVTVKA
jgi:topoisomerase IV subunit A